MTLVADLLVATIAGTMIIANLAAIALLLRTARRLRRRYRRRHPQLRALTDREVRWNARPYGADILVSPAHAPRNGSTSDTTAP